MSRMMAGDMGGFYSALVEDMMAATGE
jgi:hypothetical protein